MRAAVVQSDQSILVQEHPMPTLDSNTQILIKVVAVGLNPSDWKHGAALSDPGEMTGSDFAGVVVEIGKDVPEGAVSVGELRAGFVDRREGAFAEFVRQEYDLSFKVPGNVTAHQATTVPLPLFTAMQAMYLSLGLKWPGEAGGLRKREEEKEWILIWSGATAIGQYAIQLARASGLRVITTCSPGRNDLFKSLGAEIAIDYKNPDVSAKLFEATNGQIRLGYDTYSEGGSLEKCQLAFAKEGGKLVTTLQLPKLPRPEVVTTWKLVYTLLGDFIWKAYDERALAGEREAYLRMLALTTKMLESGQLRPVEFEDLGGLDQVERGLQILAEGKNTHKLICTV